MQKKGADTGCTPMRSVWLYLSDGKRQIKPLGRKGIDNWGGMGVTLVDSLDTLWLMGLKDEFYKGRYKLWQAVLFPSRSRRGNMDYNF